MDKQLIEKIALEVANSLSAPYVSDESAVRFATRFLARIDAERGKEAVACDCKRVMHECDERPGCRVLKSLSAPQPPAPCPNCCGQEPDDLHLRDEYMKAEREIKRLQAKVDEQILRCPDCEGRANGYSVLVPSAELKKLQARVAELEADNQKRYGTIGELSQKVADQAAEIERMKSYADDADTCIKEAKTVIAQQAEQLASAIAAIKDAESLHRIDRNAYVGEIAQQSERIAALEADNKAVWATADRHMTERNEAIERIAELEPKPAARYMNTNAHLESVVAEQAALIEQCEKGLASVEWLIGDSQGVIGLHLNGDSAPWSSLRTGGQFETWLVEFDEALAAIAAHRGQS